MGGVGSFPYQLQSYTNLKLGKVEVRLGCNNIKIIYCGLSRSGVNFLSIEKFTHTDEIHTCVPNPYWYSRGAKLCLPQILHRPLVTLIYWLSAPTLNRILGIEYLRVAL